MTFHFKVCPSTGVCKLLYLILFLFRSVRSSSGDVLCPIETPVKHCHTGIQRPHQQICKEVLPSSSQVHTQAPTYTFRYVLMPWAFHTFSFYVYVFFMFLRFYVAFSHWKHFVVSKVFSLFQTPAVWKSLPAGCGYRGEGSVYGEDTHGPKKWQISFYLMTT